VIAQILIATLALFAGLWLVGQLGAAAVRLIDWILTPRRPAAGTTSKGKP